MMFPLLASVLLFRSPHPHSEQIQIPSESAQASLRVVLRGLERDDLDPMMGSPETTYSLVSEGDAGIYYETTWKAENKTYGKFWFSTIRPTDEVVSIALHEMPVRPNVSPLSSAALSRRADSLAKQIVGGLSLASMRREDQAPRDAVQFEYYLQGSRRQGAEMLSLFLHNQTGQVLQAFLPMKVTPSEYNGDRVLDVALLEGRALSLYADARPFPQGQIAASYFFLNLPIAFETFDQPSMRAPTEGLAARLFSREQNAAYRELWRQKTAIPIYRLKVDATERHVMYQVHLDARNGNLIFAGRAEGLGGPETKSSVPLPTKISVDGTSGSLTDLGRSSQTPTGTPVYVTEGRRLFAARFEAKTGILWFQARDGAPHGAFRPDAKLRKALNRLADRRAELRKR